MLKFNRLEVVCQVCNPEAPKVIRVEPIAKFNPDQMPYPMDGMNFEAMRPQFGSSPFMPGQGWEYMTCPRCHTRPFLERNKIATTKGMFIIGEGLQLDRELLNEDELAELEYQEYLDQGGEEVVAESDNLVCPECGKECKSKAGFVSHVKSHNK